LFRHGSDPVYMKTTSWFFFILLGFLFFAAGCHKSEGPAQHINVVMRKYSIEPSVIHVKNGQPVSLDVTTADVQHGFDVPDMGIKEPVQPGHTTTITFTPQVKGEFVVKCGVICGPHHDDMSAKLVVD
jgi:cytochrome c oxidase subunit 2